MTIAGDGESAGMPMDDKAAMAVRTSMGTTIGTFQPRNEFDRHLWIAVKTEIEKLGC